MSGKIDEKLVRHVALLSRIELTAEQAERMGKVMSDVVAYMDKLQELDTTGVEPMAHALSVANVLAEDEPAASLSPEQALANAPDQQDGLFKVPKVIGDSQ